MAVFEVLQKSDLLAAEGYARQYTGLMNVRAGFAAYLYIIDGATGEEETTLQSLIQQQTQS